MQFDDNLPNFLYCKHFCVSNYGPYIICKLLETDRT